MYQKREISFPERFKLKPPDQEQARRLEMIVSSFQDFKTDFSLIFYLWTKKFVKKWYKSALFIRK